MRFTAEQLFEVFSAYNQAVFPMQIVLLAAALLRARRGLPDAAQMVGRAGEREAGGNREVSETVEAKVYAGFAKVRLVYFC